MPDPLTLPAGARLVHIGPHKTGSTALQSAFDQAREDLISQGVRYVGRTRHEAAAVRWVTDRQVAGANPAFGQRRWRAVCREFQQHSDERLAFSSEFFSDANDAQIERIVSDLGREDLWIAVTLRPLAKILPSQYQQNIQRQGQASYGKWLDAMLVQGRHASPPPHFWVRHRHDELIRRWGRLVGMERVVVVVLDARDHDFMPHAFEQVLGLRPETLAAMDATENRSLTAAETGLLRRFNRDFAAAGLDPALYVQLLRVLKDHLKERTPEPGEAKIQTPDWAITTANEIGAEMAEAIAASGAQVIGDLDSLSSVPLTGLEDAPGFGTKVNADLAASFAVGLAKATADLDQRLRSKIEKAAAQADQAPAAPAPEPSLPLRVGRAVRRRLGRR